MTLHRWDGLLWHDDAQDGPLAFCPEHRIRLEIIDSRGNLRGQLSNASTPHNGLLCPTDDKVFGIPTKSFWTYQERFKSALESTNLGDVEIIDLDGYLVPIVKAAPPSKDTDYWAEVRINDSKRGKQLVIYAGRRGSKEKTQIFVDPENDKITFDQNNLHPNDVFIKIVGDFDSGKKSTMEL